MPNNLPDEKWQYLYGYFGYEISNFGRVKSLARSVKIRGAKKWKMKQETLMSNIQVNHSNSYYVNLYKNNGERTFISIRVLMRKAGFSFPIPSQCDKS